MTVKTLSLPAEWLVDAIPRLYRERPALVHPWLHRLLD